MIYGILRNRRLCHIRAAALPDVEALPHCAAIALCRARKTYFWILPVAVLGRSLVKMTLCGALKCAMFARANSPEVD